MDEQYIRQQAKEVAELLVTATLVPKERLAALESLLHVSFDKRFGTGELQNENSEPKPTELVPVG